MKSKVLMISALLVILIAMLAIFIQDTGKVKSQNILGTQTKTEIK